MTFVIVMLSSMCVSSLFSAEQSQPEMIQAVMTPWTGDFNAMVKRNYLRALVIYSKTFYFVDRAEQMGTSYEALTELEKVINQQLKTRDLKFSIVIIPVPIDKLLSYLVEGRGDLALGNLTITPDRQKIVDFSVPVISGISEILVTNAKSSAVSTVNDLAGKEIYVRPSSSYYEHLMKLNETFKKAGKPQIKLKPANNGLEDEDILELVNAGVVSMTVVDDYLAEFWTKIYPNIRLHKDIALNTGGSIAWAFRKQSPELQNVINPFVKTHGKGTLFGNTLFNRYLKNTEWIRNPGEEQDMKRFNQTISYFKKYASQYGFDWLMVEAQSYQESRIDQNLKSASGAIGVMQLLPSTAASPQVGIPNINEVENNIHAGVKYMKFMMDTYFKDANMDPLNKQLFAFASYNAGPAEVSRLRTEASQMGLNPNVWFNNVEIVAAKRIGAQTVQYVRNIYKYYVAYSLIVEQQTNEMKNTPPSTNQK